eukprot:GEMP01065821.1.p1 GENE.GEMP01065821.1~~GEMP01065821.1.p1  ORF type:complete len:140 (-),score=18.40 GEMP01065821.1:727-1146(-)
MSFLGDVKYMSCVELEKVYRESTVKIIDVRDEDFNEGGHIPGCRNIPSRVFSAKREELADELCQQDVTVVFHCMFSQSRGPSCAGIFQTELTKRENVKCQVRILQGGFLTWERRYPDDAHIEKRTGTEGPKNFFVFGKN